MRNDNEEVSIYEENDGTQIDGFNLLVLPSFWYFFSGTAHVKLTGPVAETACFYSLTKNDCQTSLIFDSGGKDAPISTTHKFIQILQNVW